MGALTESNPFLKDRAVKPNYRRLFHLFLYRDLCVLVNLRYDGLPTSAERTANQETNVP